jgi:acyl carrier protein
MRSTEQADRAARALLTALGPEVAAIAESVAWDADLQLAGIDSANLIELGLMIEDLLGVSLSAEELDRVGTIAGIRSIIEAHTGDTP